MTKWEYKVVETGQGSPPLYWEKKINAYGNDGWELVSVCVNTDIIASGSSVVTTHQAYFKRPITTD